MPKPEELFEALITEVKTCTNCRTQLPLEPKPILQANPEARLLIAGQAPGRKAHESGKPFDDLSGDRLREWMGIDRGIFYDPKKIAIIPIGFCFPGSGRSGDLPPRTECTQLWRERLLKQLPKIKTTLIIGHYAQQYHLTNKQQTVTEAVRSYHDNWPAAISLPHPSPRNNLWLRRNPWFEQELIPELQLHISKLS
jgi:uracil-DNA glycosylase